MLGLLSDPLMAAVPVLVTLGGLGYAYLVFNASRGKYTDLFFWLALGVAFFAPLVQAIVHRPLGFLAELVLLAATPLSLIGLYRRRTSVPGLTVYLMMLGAFVLWELLVTIRGRSIPVAAGYQFATNMKPFLMMAFGFGLAWSPRTEKWFWRFVGTCWLYIYPFVAWQALAPGSFQAVFSASFVEHALNPFLPFLVRSQGPLGYSSVLASLCIALFLLCLTRLFVDGKRPYLMPLLAYGGLIVLAGQRQEAAALLVVCILGLLVGRWRLSIRSLMLSAVLVAPLALGALHLVAPDAVVRESQLWEAGATSGPAGARAALYDAAVHIANAQHPFGAGLGRFGGVGAAKFDTRLYVEAGLGGYWWFREGMYLMDSVMACYIAELGWWGLGGLGLLLVMPLAWLHRQYRQGASAGTGLGLYAFMAATYAVLVSPTAFVITDPGMGLLCFVGIGLICSQRGHPNLSGVRLDPAA